MIGSAGFQALFFATTPLLAASHATGHTDSCIRTQSLKFVGADLLPPVSVIDDGACAELCITMSSCYHFTLADGLCHVMGAISYNQQVADPNTWSGDCSDVEAPSLSDIGCDIDYSTNYEGHDLAYGLATGDATGCAALCKAMPLCTHFTFIWNGCYPKTSSAGSQPKVQGTSGTCAKVTPTIVAGAKVCTFDAGQDYSGSDLPNGRIASAASDADCALLCADREDCNAFTFIWGACYLKADSAGRTANINGFSGTCAETTAIPTTVILSSTDQPCIRLPCPGTENDDAYKSDDWEDDAPPATNPPSPPTPAPTPPPTTSEPTTSEPTTSEPTTSEPTVAVVTSTRTPDTTQPALIRGIYESAGTGCCRAADGGSGDFLVHTTETIEECEDLCEATKGCLGIEFVLQWKQCEVHLSPISHTSTWNKCSCFKRIAAAPTAPAITTSTTVAPSPSPTPVPATSEPTPAPTAVETTEPAAGGCVLEQGVDFAGHDIFQGMQNGDSADDCIALCLANPACNAFSFIWGKCWLKSSDAGRQLKAQGVSAVCTNGPVSPTAPPPTPTPPPTAPPPPGAGKTANFNIVYSNNVAGPPKGKHEAQGAVANGKLYVFGGFVGGFTWMDKQTMEYTPVTNSWAQRAPMPIFGDGITHAANIVSGNNIFVVGGLALRSGGRWPGGAYATSQVYSYNTASNSWDTTSYPDIPEARGGCAGAMLNGHLHIFGGATYEGRHGGFLEDKADHWSLDLSNPSAGWVRRADLSVARNHLGGATYNGKIYAIGGQFLELEGCSNQNTMESYSPATNSWTTLPNIPVGLGHISPSVVASDYGILVVGGIEDKRSGCAPPGKASKGIYHFDPYDNTWSFKGTGAIGGASMVSGMIGNTIYAQYSGNAYKIQLSWSDAVEYAVGAASATDTNNMDSATNASTQAVLVAGCVVAAILVVGLFGLVGKRMRAPACELMLEIDSDEELAFDFGEYVTDDMAVSDDQTTRSSVV